ncbi:ATP-binding cassette domain-containing protein, partial [Glaesserella parasuis]|uniref:ATP-binding cassette domain-containing protein n=1 Tax=Glaesserella parasuis TaxID=738 RepID=UPI003B7B0ED9
LQYAAMSMGVLPSEAPQRVAHVAGQLGLADLLERLPTELSRGQRQRVAIGQAIVHQPRVLLLDEPAAGLRHLEKQALADLLRQLRAEGLGILVVEHDMEFVMNLADRITVLEFGTVIAEGTPAQIQVNQRVLDAYLGGGDDDEAT